MKRRFILPVMVAAGLGLAANQAYGGWFSRKADDIKMRIVHRNTSAVTHWQKAEEARQNHEYETARFHYAQVVAAGPGLHNPNFNEAGDYINIGGKDKLFKLMASHYERAMAAEYSAADALLTKAKKLPQGSQERSELEQKATALLQDVVAKKETLCEELAKRGRTCK